MPYNYTKIVHQGMLRHRYKGEVIHLPRLIQMLYDVGNILCDYS